MIHDPTTRRHATVHGATFPGMLQCSTAQPAGIRANNRTPGASFREHLFTTTAIAQTPQAAGAAAT